ncbi:DUF2490 domain-containing protein [Paucihalobacter ruber]|uniref:DUF2490 domain-containing protein n=1 Tax=Paucihalobacter ruber TaxID=2567861 RepID=UPI001C1EDDA8|nr:DUF2490 domain-containing protein [Paucihalobacter ruber]
MNIKYCFIAGILVLTIWVSKAQSSYELGWLPSLTFNKKLPKDYVINFKAESRQVMESGVFNSDISEGYDYVLTDFTTIIGKKIGMNTSLNLGYLFRVENNVIIHRSIQQLIWVNRYEGFKLGHRLATDQTFEPGEAPAYRLRYRMVGELPLSGLEVDVNEFYIKAGTEYLNELQSGKYEGELRLMPFLGYALNPKQKLELGLDYRLGNFINGPPEHTFWIGMNWYVSL